MITVDDVAEEMVGMQFKLRTAQGSPPDKLPAGSTVVVLQWDAKASDATVRYMKGARPLDLRVLKLALEPSTPSTKGVRRYSVGLSGQRMRVERLIQSKSVQKDKLQKWRADERKYVKSRTYWENQLHELEKEMARLKDELPANQHVLSQMLVREAMYNRFDQAIANWVSHYNKALPPTKPLDPNIIKSMTFKESRMGTSGVHLDKPPYSWNTLPGHSHPIRSRFNLMQAIDSSGHQQLLMIDEMAPALYKTYKLGDLVKELRAQDKTESQLYAWNGGTLVKAMRDFFAARDASGRNLMGTLGRDLHLDYEFWIRTSVRWLFSKYMGLSAGTRTWPEAVRAYNGDGPKARAYRQDVMSRVGDMSTLTVGNN